MRTVLGSFILGAIAVLALSTPSKADDRTELKQNVKWSIFHEGCRVFAANDQIGNMRDIRTCIYNTQSQNQRALDLIGSANDDLLLEVVTECSNEIPGEFQLRDNFSWVMYHEGRKEQIRVMLENGNYEGIRSLYHQIQDHNPNARNLLAAVSNPYIRDLVNSL